MLIALLGTGIYGFMKFNPPISGKNPSESVGDLHGHCVEKELKLDRFIAGRIITDAEPNGTLGLIRVGLEHENESLVLYSYKDFPVDKTPEKIYFKLYELDGLPMADSIVTELNGRLSYGGNAYTNLKWHSIFGHDHNPEGIGPLHTKIHLVGTRIVDGTKEWEFRESGSNIPLILKGGDQHWSEYGNWQNREVWIEYEIGNELLMDIDTCHRHGTEEVDCIK